MLCKIVQLTTHLLVYVITIAQHAQNIPCLLLRKILQCEQACGIALLHINTHDSEMNELASIAFSLSLACFATVVVLVLREELPLVVHFPAGSVMIGALFGIPRLEDVGRLCKGH